MNLGVDLGSVQGLLLELGALQVLLVLSLLGGHEVQIGPFGLGEGLVLLVLITAPLSARSGRATPSASASK